MEPDETTLSRETEFVRTWTDEHLFLHLRHVGEIHLPDRDNLALEELIRRLRTARQAAEYSRALGEP